MGLVCSLLAPAMLYAAGPAQQPPPAPNFVLILADDLGYGDLGCYGSARNRTAHLDQLAREGMRFTDFYANAPKCSPTRAALLTGRYQQRSGIEDVFKWDEPETDRVPERLHLSEVTLAEVLKTAGYVTGMFGKWHLGPRPEFGPHLQGFDEFWGNLSGNIDYFSHVDGPGRPDLWRMGVPVKEKGYYTDLITERALDFIGRQRDRRFFLYVPYLAIHSPMQGPGDGPLRTTGSDARGRKAEKRDRHAVMTEMLARMDAGIGRIVARLRELGLERNTVVFFTSDNGGVLSTSSNAPCRGGKGELWEGGLRVPAIAWRPGRIAPGSVCRETVLSMDLFPTLVRLAGASIPAGRLLDGVDLSPVLFGSGEIAERTVCWRFLGQKAARRGPWKWVEIEETAGLYHLGEDVGETRDRTAEHPAVARELAAAFRAWEADVTRNAHWTTAH